MPRSTVRGKFSALDGMICIRLCSFPPEDADFEGTQFEFTAKHRGQRFIILKHELKLTLLQMLNGITEFPIIPST